MPFASPASVTRKRFTWFQCLIMALFLPRLIHAQSGSATAIAGAGNLPGNLRLSELRVHDPWILAYAPTRTYYLYSANNGRSTGVNRPGTMAYRSHDLLNWEGPIVVFTLPDGTWAATNQPAWAPEVHEYRNRFYLLTTLHNSNSIIATPPEVWRTTYRRGTVIASSSSPEGPFTLLETNGPVPPADFMTLDGTLFVDPAGKPWMVYAHEWIQKIDGTMEAVPLADDLSGAAGAPIYLFKGSDAPWLDADGTASTRENSYVTDGPELFRTRDGHLLMLWSSYENGSYVETVARSKSGELKGPWDQLDPLVRQDSGHGMLFRTFDGQLMLVLHRPFRNARAKLYEISDEGDHLRIIRQRTDLDGGQ
jgi:beta-xylosidase